MGDKNKLKHEVESKLGSEFKVQEMNKSKPKIKIVDIEEPLSEEEVKKQILNQNTTINENEVEIEVKIVKNENQVDGNTIVEMDNVFFKKVVEMGKIKICNVFEHINILCYYKCFGYNHNAER